MPAPMNDFVPLFPLTVASDIVKPGVVPFYSLQVPHSVSASVCLKNYAFPHLSTLQASGPFLLPNSFAYIVYYCDWSIRN